MTSIGLKKNLDGTVNPFSDPNENEMFNESETKCLKNCASKLFTTENIFRNSLNSRIHTNQLTKEDLWKRINNPTDSIGPYFLTTDFETKQS